MVFCHIYKLYLNYVTKLLRFYGKKITLLFLIKSKSSHNKCMVSNLCVWRIFHHTSIDETDCVRVKRSNILMESEVWST